MRLSACTCGAEHLERIPRSWWMRLITSRRHYQCSRCEATMFIPKVYTVQASAPMALPPAPPRFEQPQELGGS